MDGIFLPEPIIFEWDEGNREKNWLRHNVSIKESEQAFFDPNRRLWKDILHSGKEWRYIILGKSEANKILFTVFTIRQQRVRIISSRNADRQERSMYEQSSKK